MGGVTPMDMSQTWVQNGLLHIRSLVLCLFFLPRALCWAPRLLGTGSKGAPSRVAGSEHWRSPKPIDSYSNYIKKYMFGGMNIYKHQLFQGFTWGFRGFDSYCHTHYHLLLIVVSYGINDISPLWSSISSYEWIIYDYHNLWLPNVPSGKLT